MHDAPHRIAVFALTTKLDWRADVIRSLLYIDTPDRAANLFGEIPSGESSI
jgi:hypothetical protein